MNNEETERRKKEEQRRRSMVIQERRRVERRKLEERKLKEKRRKSWVSPAPHLLSSTANVSTHLSSCFWRRQWAGPTWKLWSDLDLLFPAHLRSWRLCKTALQQPEDALRFVKSSSFSTRVLTLILTSPGGMEKELSPRTRAGGRNKIAMEAELAEVWLALYLTIASFLTEFLCCQTRCQLSTPIT